MCFRCMATKLSERTSRLTLRCLEKRQSKKNSETLQTRYRSKNIYMHICSTGDMTQGNVNEWTFVYTPISLRFMTKWFPRRSGIIPSPPLNSCVLSIFYLDVKGDVVYRRCTDADARQELQMCLSVSAVSSGVA